MMIYLRYVPYDQVSAHEDKGWKVHTAPMLGNHGNFSVLMQYEGDDEPA